MSVPGLERLREMGHELRRPEADFLRDGVYELRVSLQGVHHRILYFFHVTIAAVVSHGPVRGEPDEAHLRGGWTWLGDRTQPSRQLRFFTAGFIKAGQPG
jgi:hypothetical protein